MSCLNGLWNGPAHGISNELGTQAQSLGASAIVLKARSDVQEIAFELRVEVALLKHRCKVLEQELRLLQIPKNENWSA